MLFVATTFWSCDPLMRSIAGPERTACVQDALIERAKILIIASHSDALIESMCNRAILLRSGRIVADGSVAEVTAIYKHLGATGYLPGETAVVAEPAPVA